MGAVMSISEKMGKRFCCLHSSTTLSRFKSSNDATRHVEILMEGYIQNKNEGGEEEWQEDNHKKRKR